jgi:hypothetical protein
MKLEKRIGNKSVYTEVIAGRTVRATTVNGEKGAERIFEIMRKTNGIARSPSIAQDLATARHRR